MKFSYFFLALTLVVIGVVAIAGFRGHHFTRPPFEIFPDMNYQDKVKDQVPSQFFSDGNSAREPIPGTVAEEMPAANDYWATGKWDDTHWGDGIPVHESRDGGRALAIDDMNMARGRERYSISCAVCHGASGDGQGITSKYGLNGAASYHVDRLRQATDGELFNTISNGKGQMFGYGYNITIDDRWRIVMYIRALQMSQNAQYTDASPTEQAALDKTKKPATPPAPAAPAAPAPDATPAPAKPPGTAYDNKNTTGHFSFDVGYQFGGDDDQPSILSPASKGKTRFDLNLDTNALSVNLPHPLASDSPIALGYDVRSQVYGLATDSLLKLALDLGGQWRQPGDVVSFVPIRWTLLPIGPLRLDYGKPYVASAASAKPSGMARNNASIPPGYPAGSRLLMTTDSHGNKVPFTLWVDAGRHNENVWVFPYPTYLEQGQLIYKP